MGVGSGIRAKTQKVVPADLVLPPGSAFIPGQGEKRVEVQQCGSGGLLGTEQLPGLALGAVLVTRRWSWVWMHPLAASCPKALQYQRFPSKKQNQDKRGRKKSLEALLTPLGSWGRRGGTMSPCPGGDTSS